MWPPVPVDLKQCVADSTFPCGTRIPKGTVMVYTPYLLSRLPEFYKSTTGLQHWAQDCTEFKPSRWLVSDSSSAVSPSSSSDDHDASNGVSSRKILNPSPYEFISFNAGLRMCLGKSMAILEVSLRRARRDFLPNSAVCPSPRAFCCSHLFSFSLSFCPSLLCNRAKWSPQPSCKTFTSSSVRDSSRTRDSQSSTQSKAECPSRSKLASRRSKERATLVPGMTLLPPPSLLYSHISSQRPLLHCSCSAASFYSHSHSPTLVLLLGSL